MSPDSDNQAGFKATDGAAEVASLLSSAVNGQLSEVADPVAHATASVRPEKVVVESRQSGFGLAIIMVNTLAIIATVSVLAWFITRPPIISSTVVVDRSGVNRPAGEHGDVRPEQTAVASWGQAQASFASGSFEQALGMYNSLLKAQQTDGVHGDLLRLRMGDCLAKLRRPTDAIKLYQSVANSPSAVLACLASYQLARIELSSNQPMQARWHVYRTAAMAAFAGGDATRREADFLAARALTSKVLAIYGLELPMDLNHSEPLDVLANLDESAVSKMLDDATNRLAAATLGPQIRKLPGEDSQRFDLLCRNANVEEVLVALAGQLSVNVRWMSADTSIRRRSVTMAFTDESPQRLAEVACGSAGLVARFADGEILVYDPEAMEALKDQQMLLAEEASATWRRLSLIFPEDRRMPVGQLALGAITEAAGDTLGAINAYQMVARRYRRSDVAPLAMLRCAKLRISLRDFTAAREDLRDMLANYTDSPYIDEAHLMMARSTQEAGMHDDALKAYTRLHLRELTASVRAQVCRGAGECCFRKGDYKDAAKWLTQYVNLSEGTDNAERVEALIMLGKAQAVTGRLVEATSALYLALGAKPSETRRCDAILELAEVLTQRKMFAAAIGALGELETHELAGAQHVRLLVLTGGAYRLMGSPDKAIAYLSRAASSLDDPAAQAPVKLEIARCQIQVGQENDAYKTLTEILPHLSGDEAALATCELAEVCLKIAKPQQAVTLCNELKKTAKEPLLTRVRKVLSQAYIDQKDYENAALALSGSQSGGPK